ncbi:hypothetical protein [Maioricimonas rarisocia]|uniref:hypothetical protein n=1 Tax=Maioricimonas rarisocia TaxID=2528026 RepID=UPI0011A9D531|nr:hypothetical protein [Maioricimonas rarisocia]
MGRVQSQQQASRVPAGSSDLPARSCQSRDRWRRCVARLAVACVTLWTAGLAIAQQPAAPPADAPAGPAAPTTTPITRDMTLEYVIVLAMVGLALFAVCRSTRRN